MYMPPRPRPRRRPIAPRPPVHDRAWFETNVPEATRITLKEYWATVPFSEKWSDQRFVAFSANEKTARDAALDTKLAAESRRYTVSAPEKPKSFSDFTIRRIGIMLDVVALPFHAASWVLGAVAVPIRWFNNTLIKPDSPSIAAKGIKMQNGKPVFGANDGNLPLVGQPGKSDFPGFFPKGKTKLR